jgi:hypothetical protein
MRTKKITYNPHHYKSGMASVVYGDGTHKIRQQKVVIRTTPKGTMTKVVDYSPINYYGKQNKTKTKTKSWK